MNASHTYDWTRLTDPNRRHEPGPRRLTRCSPHSMRCGDSQNPGNSPPSPAEDPRGSLCLLSSGVGCWSGFVEGAVVDHGVQDVDASAGEADEGGAERQRRAA